MYDVRRSQEVVSTVVRLFIYTMLLNIYIMNDVRRRREVTYLNLYTYMYVYIHISYLRCPQKSTGDIHISG
jgi:hypothetical protein